ncbi:unnamed protein product [Clavelina lepadiformis]|uniref:C-type lectin domain-containing protein n=1 Tax=Clavelina lepadiformis TaxID=159417 RepID=A0ABP0F476_CLALP
MSYALLTVLLLGIFSNAHGCCDSVSQMQRELRASIDPDFYVPFNGYKYRLTQNSLNYDHARAACEEMGGDLAVFGMRDLTTRRFIHTALDKKDSWIGLNDINEEGQFKWLRGVRTGDEHWKEGEPNDSWDNEDCVQIVSDAMSNDMDCTKNYHGLCEIRI